MLHIQHENGKPRQHAMTSRKDVDELKRKPQRSALLVELEKQKTQLPIDN